MNSATLRLVALAERLNPTGHIGDGMVAQFHALAKQARAEQGAPECFASRPGPQQAAENGCAACRLRAACEPTGSL